MTEKQAPYGSEAKRGAKKTSARKGPQDEYIDDADEKVGNNTVAIEARELRYLTDLAAAAHAVVVGGAGLAILEDSYEKYTWFCFEDGRKRPALRLSRVNERTKTRLISLLAEVDTMVQNNAEWDDIKAKWDKMVTAYTSVMGGKDRKEKGR